jgi:hypothetical protein
MGAPPDGRAIGGQLRRSADARGTCKRSRIGGGRRRPRNLYGILSNVYVIFFDAELVFFLQFLGRRKRYRACLYREQVAAVMQEDQLLSGSIADNICFFDPGFDHERMVLCAQTAGVHDEIMAMPMAYNSLIGDMGSSLSGGQKQRVLLARALY